MKKILAIFALLLFGTVIYAVAGSGRESYDLPPQEIKIMYSSEDHGYQQKDINGKVRFLTLPDGGIVTKDTSGTTDTYIPSNRVVYITQATQLSSWGSADSAVGGQSYFQCEPGVTYLVDMYALYSSGVTAGNGVSAFTKVTFSGVSAILPNSVKYSGAAYDVTIRMVTTGGVTGYLDAGTGNSPVQVWPYPGTVSGLTAYGKPAQTYDTVYRSGNTPQSMYGPVANSTGSLVTGGSRWVVNKLGEQATFSMYTGHVSTYVVSPHIPR